MEYRIRKNFTITDDGHTMRATGKNGIDTMTSASHDINIEVDIRLRNKTLSAGYTKKTMSTRKCFDNSSNYKKRIMTNKGLVTEHGTVIDTSRASDGEYKNSRCVSTRNDSELHTAKKDRFIEMMLKLRKLK